MKVLQLILIVLTSLGVLCVNGAPDENLVTGAVYALFCIMIVAILYVVRRRHLETMAAIQAMADPSQAYGTAQPGQLVAVLHTSVGRAA